MIWGKHSSFAFFSVFAFLFVPLACTQVPIKTLHPPQQSDSSPSAESLSRSDSVLAQAKSMANTGMATAAEGMLRPYLREHEDSADAHFLLGYILFRKIQEKARTAGTADSVDSSDSGFRETSAKDSLAEYTEGAKYRAPSASDLKIVALDYVLLGDYLDADKWLTKMLEWTPYDADGWYNLGRTKYSENRFEEAIQAFQRCLNLDPKNVKAEDNLGLAYAGLGRDEEAIAAYQQAMVWQVQTTAKNPGPSIDLGSLLIDQNRLQEAVSYLMQAIEIAPRDSRAHELLGKAYARLEDLPKAQLELEKAVALSPSSANLPCILAPIYRKQGVADKAKAESDRCAALTGSHSTPETPRP